MAVKSAPLPPPPLPADFLERPTDARVAYLRQQATTSFAIKKPDPDVHRSPEHGFLWHYLWLGHLFTWQRWQYWNATATAGHLLEAPIPECDLQDVFDPGRKRTRQMLEASLEAVSPSWQGWGSWDGFEYLLRWLLYAFGDRQQLELPKELHSGSSDRLYQVFNLEPMLLWPSDYFSNLFSESRVGRHAGFYPTPHSVSKMMADITMGDEDLRLASFNEPAIGTGRMALFAADHSMVVTGQDINPLCVLACKVNAWLYAPWMAVPIRWMWRTALGHAEIDPSPIKLSPRGERLVAAGQQVLF